MESDENQTLVKSDAQDAAPRSPDLPVSQSPNLPISPFTLPLLAILLLAFALRFYCLTCSSLWHDEGNTWALVQRSFAQIARNSAADIHPPGYYWLLKVWTAPFGASAWGIRSFSALAGTLTVAVIYAIAHTVTYTPHTPHPAPISQSPISHLQSPISNLQSPLFPLLVALLAALNPFQIYYSQEARMYALLMLESALLVWAALELRRRQRADRGRLALYALIAAAGLWTHYIFPLILAAVACAYLWTFLRSPRSISTPRLLPFILANVAGLVLYLPWLPTALDRVLHWPAGGLEIGWATGLGLTLQTLTVGPIRSGPELAWPWLVLAGLLPLLGLWRLRRSPAGAFLGLWLLAPVGLMFALGLFSDAFLKFLLVASPAWCILTAAGAGMTDWPGDQATDTRQAPNTRRRALRLAPYALLICLSLLLAYAALPGYYTDPAARDNYAGMARTAAALGDPDTDLVVLDAPGQQEVWSYYDPGLPVLALPRARPPDPPQVEAELAAAVEGRRRVFALFWATDQADPQGLVEGFLDRAAFKGLESWQGNVRFVIYRFASGLTCRDLEPTPRFASFAGLEAICMETGRAVAPGQVLPVGLRWRVLDETKQRFKITLQLLDSRNQVIAQRDGEPAGSARPTDGWRAGEVIEGRHGVYVPPGTPPGVYRLILALYDSRTGQRAPVDGGPADHLEAAQVQVRRSDHPLPGDIAPMQHRVNRRLGPVILVGYDMYKRGYAHAPETPLRPGDTLHVTLYWQAPDPLPTDWPQDLVFTLALGEQTITAPLAGGGFPTGLWQAGDLVRGEFDLQVPAVDEILHLTVAGHDQRLGPIPSP